MKFKHIFMIIVIGFLVFALAATLTVRGDTACTELSEQSDTITTGQDDVVKEDAGYVSASFYHLSGDYRYTIHKNGDLVDFEILWYDGSHYFGYTFYEQEPFTVDFNAYIKPILDELYAESTEITEPYETSADSCMVYFGKNYCGRDFCSVAQADEEIIKDLTFTCNFHNMTAFLDESEPDPYGPVPTVMLYENTLLAEVIYCAEDGSVYRYGLYSPNDLVRCDYYAKGEYYLTNNVSYTMSFEPRDGWQADIFLNFLIELGENSEQYPIPDSFESFSFPDSTVVVIYDKTGTNGYCFTPDTKQFVRLFNTINSYFEDFPVESNWFISTD